MVRYQLVAFMEPKPPQLPHENDLSYKPLPNKDKSYTLGFSKIPVNTRLLISYTK